MKEVKTILYQKVGKRYIQVGTDFMGFPCEGIWLVTKSGMKKDWSGCLIMRLADTPTVMTFAAFSRHREAIAAEIGRAWKWEAMSPLDLADLAIRAVAKAEEPPR